MARILGVFIALSLVLDSLYPVFGYDTLMVVGGYYYDSDVGVNKYLRYRCSMRALRKVEVTKVIV